MADTTKQVLIEFITDTSQLESSTDRLEEQGKVSKKNAEEFRKTNLELQRQQKAIEGITAITKKIDEAGKVTKKNLSDLAKIIKSQSAEFQSEIKKGVIESLKQAAVEVKHFEEALEGAVSPTIKQQLRELVEQMAEMKVAGQDNTEQYKLLAQEAGRLKDAIGDANQEVKNFGSDTSNLDGLLQIAGGVTGIFSVAQGAVALFADENEELQKVLLRVNATMAILQGLQQLQITLQKESAAAKLADVIVTRAQTVAMAAFNFVVGSSTGLLKIFRIALAATGVGLLVIGIIELVQALKSSNNELEEANFLLDQQSKRIESVNRLIEHRIAVEEANAKAAEALESRLQIIRAKGVQAERDALIESNKILAEQRDSLDRTSEAWFNLNEQIEKNTDTIQDLNTEIVVANINIEKQLADEREEALKKRVEAAKKEAEENKRLAKERRAAEFEDFQAGIQVRLLATKEGSKEELELKKELLRATLQIDLDNEKLTINQKRLLIQKFFKDRMSLEKDFNRELSEQNFKDALDNIQSDLNQLEISNEEKLRLTEQAIQVQAAMEIQAAEGNASRIAAIEAERDKKIREARISSIQQVVNYEIALSNATNGPSKRRLQQEADNEKLRVQDRISAINQLARLDSEAIQKRIDALNKEREQKLISEQEYKLRYAELVDEQLRVWEDSEKKKTDITKQESEKRKQKTIEDIQLIVEVTTQVVDILNSLYQLQADKENNDLERRKKELEELKQAGAITEKEAITRQKRLEAEEKRIRRQQAEREKLIATFNAFLAIPQAFLKGLTQGGPILAAIYAGLALGQAILVASRPIPKFGKGKKNRYEGPAEVGETGAEIIESQGKMYVASKRQFVWLGKDDKVFNPQETIAMLSKPAMNTERIIKTEGGKQVIPIDYKRMGKEIGKHLKTNVYVDGVQAMHIAKQEMVRYLNAKRG